MFKKIISFFDRVGYKVNAALCAFFGTFFGFMGRHKYLAAMGAGFMLTAKAYAQTAAFKQGTEKLTEMGGENGLQQWINPVQKLCYALAGIVAIVGSISVYIKMNNEEQDVKKSIMMIVGAVIFLLAAATALPAMLGYENISQTGISANGQN